MPMGIAGIAGFVRKVDSWRMRLGLCPTGCLGRRVTKSNDQTLIQRSYTVCRYGQMHYRQAGPHDASTPTLVLLHQNPSSSYEYEALIEAMAADRRVIAFDTPGYGMSDAPPAPPGMAAYAAAFADALDAMGIEGPVDLYGFHTGTLLSIELAIARPELVGRVALTGIPMYPAEDLAKKLKEAQDYPEPDEEGTVILKLLDNLWTYVVRNRDAAVPLDKAVRNFADKARVLHRFTWAYQGVWSWDYSRLALMTRPALLLQPAEDLADISLAAASLLHDSTVRHLPELDRDIFDVAPERIAHELRTYFPLMPTFPMRLSRIRCSIPASSPSRSPRAMPCRARSAASCSIAA